MESEPFLIHSFDRSLVVMPRSEARRLAALNEALERCMTWGEFVHAVADDAATRRYLEDAFDNELPDADRPFDAEELPGFADGDWPTWPKQAMLEWLPNSVTSLGTIETTMLNGDYLHLDESLVDDVIEALAAEGIEAYEDPGTIVSTACGAWRYE